MDDTTAQTPSTSPVNPDPVVPVATSVGVDPQQANAVPPAPAAAAAAPSKPEMVIQDGERHSNKALIFVSVLILVIVLGIFGMFVYLKVANAPAKGEPAVASPTTQTNVAAPSPAAKEPTVEELTASADAGLDSLDKDLISVDSGLNDKQGDLSEN